MPRAYSGILVVLTTVLTYSAACGAGPATPEELLERWQDAAARTKTCSATTEQIFRVNARWTHGDRWSNVVERLFREENGRFQTIRQSLQNLPAQAKTDATTAKTTISLWDGKDRLYSFRSTPGAKIWRGSILSPTTRAVEEARRNALGSEFDGELTAEDVPFRQLLRKMHLVLAPHTDTVAGAECYVIRAVGDYGAFKLWFDPTHDFNLARFHLRRDGNNIFFGMQLPRPSIGGGMKITSNEVSGEITRFEQIDGRWFPIELTSEITTTYEDGSMDRSISTLSRSQLNVKPDFAALGAFIISVPNGTPVSYDKGGGIRWMWKDGKPVPNIDGPATRRLDRAVEILRQGATTPTTGQINSP